MVLSMSRHLEAAEAASILEAVTGGQNVPLPAPPPPVLMTLSIWKDGVPVVSYGDVSGSGLAGPSTFRINLLDGRILYFDMTARDFILTPQAS